MVSGARTSLSTVYMNRDNRGDVARFQKRNFVLSWSTDGFVRVKLGGGEVGGANK